MDKFNLIKAIFWLLAFVVVITMGLIAFGSVTCTVAVWMGWHEPGTCIKAGIADEMHSIWTEILTAILALLAVRPRPPDDKG